MTAVTLWSNLHAELVVDLCC